MSVRALSAAAAIVASSVPGGANAASLQPTGKWVVHFDDTQCLAQRDYGPSDDPVVLLLKQPPRGDVLQFAIAVKRGSTSATEYDGKIIFDGTQSAKASILLYGPSGQAFRFYSTNLKPEQLPQLRNARSVQLHIPGFDETVNLSDMDNLLTVMASCVADLRQFWNIDEPARSSIAKSARGNLQGTFNSEDYPSDALHGSESGRVTIAILINEAGKVADCSVVATSGVAVLDAQACAAVKERARFQPAVDVHGKPTRDSYVQTIVWKLG